MSLLDIIVLGILVISAIFGFKKGFISELASLVALILGVWGAIKFAGYTQIIIEEHIKQNMPYSNVIAFIVTLLVIVVVVHLISSFVQKLIEAVNLSIVNRIFGALFSVIKTAFFLGVLMVIVDRFDRNLHFLPEGGIESHKVSGQIYNITTKTFPFIQDLYEKHIDKSDDCDDEPAPDSGMDV